MYVEIEYDNSYERMRLALASRRAAEGWRFRHTKSQESRMLGAAWMGVKELVRRFRTDVLVFCQNVTLSDRNREYAGPVDGTRSRIASGGGRDDIRAVIR